VSELSEDELAIQAKRRKTARFSFPGQAHEIAARIAEAGRTKAGIASASTRFAEAEG
jgi:hypothetical protein